MRCICRESILWLLGGILYVLVEMLWRGHSHWTMFVLGGLCFVLIGGINEVIPWCMPLWQQAVTGMLIITCMEFITGCIVNLWLGWNIWDYSRLPFNIWGQICLPYMLLWLPVSVAGIVLDDYLRYWLYKEEKPHYC